jgi:hypothetical protein
MAATWRFGGEHGEAGLVAVCRATLMRVTISVMRAATLLRSQPAQGQHQPIGGGMDQKAELVGRGFVTGGAVRGEMQLVRLDQVLGLPARAIAKAAIGKRVTVVDHPDGRLSIRCRGVELAYRSFDKLGHVSQAAIVENKQLGAALAFIREEQLRREPERRSGPRLRDQHDARLFKVG